MSSTKTVKDLTIEDVQDLFDSVIFLRGEEYFEEGLEKQVEKVIKDIKLQLHDVEQSSEITVELPIIKPSMPR